ncbi:MAG: YkgJ family cysteine cluster protein [Citrobacter sp.]
MNDHLIAARARMADPATDRGAVERSRAIIEHLNVGKLEYEVGRAMQEDAPVNRMVWMMKAADTFGAATQGKVACRDGCAHCCYQPVLISAAEAQLIAQHTATPMKSPNFVGDSNPVYVGAACNFLVDNRCSIYEARPFACRVHYTMDVDSLLCQVVPGVTDLTTPLLNNIPMFEALGVVMEEHILKVADVRDWF